MTYLSGEFRERAATIQALRDLKASGINAEDLNVFSDAPLEIPRDALARKSHMSLGVVLGAIAAAFLIIGFVYFAQHDYPITTGGMPIFSLWATGVVFYEMTMFGAIVSSLFWFLYESGLLRRVHRIPPPAWTQGLICLRVRCPTGLEENVQRVLEKAGATGLNKTDETT